MNNRVKNPRRNRENISANSAHNHSSEIRDEAVARGKALFDDPDYPDFAVAKALAGIIMPMIR